jgi:hypothetical protein
MTFPLPTIATAIREMQLPALAIAIETGVMTEDAAQERFNLNSTRLWTLASLQPKRAPIQ